MRIGFDFVIAIVMAAFTLWPLSQAWVWRWKDAQKRLDQMRRYEVGFGKPSEKTQRAMQSGTFHQIEEELVVLGFGVLGEYVIAGGTSDEVPLSDAPIASPFGSDVKQEFRFGHASVCRVLVHPEHRCIASVTSPISTLGDDNNPYLSYLIASVGDGWTYTSHADLPPALLEMESSPRDLSSFEGQIAVKPLLEAHLRRRAEIARTGGFAWGVPPSIEQLMEWETQRYARIREWAKGRSISSLQRAERQGRRKPQREWLGELSGSI